MSGIDAFHNVIAILGKQFTVSTEAVEELRVILEKQHNRPVTHQEAEAVGRSLVNVVETLANGRTITVQRRSHE